MKTIELTCEVRERLGSKTAGAARKQGKAPVVVYGSKENYHVFVQSIDLEKIIAEPGQKKVSLDINGTTITTIIKDVQYHPVTDKILHCDLLELVSNKAVITEIPVRTVGRAKGVANGGKLTAKLRKVRVKVTPENLVDFIECDVTPVKLGKSFRVKDMLSQLEGKMEVLHAPSIPVASVIVPRALRSAGLGEDEEEGGEEAKPEEAAAE